MSLTPYLVELIDFDDDTIPHVVYARDITDALGAFDRDYFDGCAGVTVRELDDEAFRAFVASTKPQVRNPSQSRPSRRKAS